MAVFLTLGQVTFSNYEIPERMPFGGSQMLSKKTFVGGQRQIDAMGRDDRPISWEGRFRGSSGLSRARFLDSMRISGQQYPLFYSVFNYNVVIKEFLADFERFYEIPYNITVEVISDNTQPVNTVMPVAYDDAIDSMILEMEDLANAIADPSVSSAIALLSYSVNAVPSMSNASNSVLSSIQPYIDTSQAAVSSSISSTTASIF